MEIAHTVPQIGYSRISLFAPADRLYAILRSERELTRLSRLRHLGVLAHILHGARQARIDYTAALLYFSNALKVTGLNSSFVIGNVTFSSQTAALQCISLIWNIGHLPGTFAVEKGLYRHLRIRSNDRPADLFPWPNREAPDVREVIERANSLLLESDFLGVARVLAVVKLLLLANEHHEPFLSSFARDFAAPFMLDYDTNESSQWGKLRMAYSLVRHLAYLTVDAHLSGLQWAPNIPTLLDQQVAAHGSNLQTLVDNISEILSPVERMTYHSIYHNPDARKEVAAIATWVCDSLNLEPEAQQRITLWLREGLFQRLLLGPRPRSSSLHRVAAVRLRSLLSPVPDVPVNIEQTLARDFSHPVVFHYRAWNSKALLEPDELVIDVLNGVPAKTADVGRIILWLMRRFEDFSRSADLDMLLLFKNEIDSAYGELVSRAVTLAFGELSLEFAPWDMSGLGVFEEGGVETKNGLWASNARLDEPFIKYMTRRRRRNVAEPLQSQQKELLGLTVLREWIRRNSRRTGHLRQRWLVAASGVVFSQDGARRMEFDGGMMRVSTRSGKLTWYGLETKSGAAHPDTSLRRRLRRLQIPAEIHRLNVDHAVAVVELP